MNQLLSGTLATHFPLPKADCEETMKLIVGLIFHKNAEREEHQASEARMLARGLSAHGITTDIVNASFQAENDSSRLLAFQSLRAVFSRAWAQEIHHLREFRRRRGSSLGVSLVKRQRAFARVMRVVMSPTERKRALVRFDVEAALTRKHQYLWTALANSDADGAIVLEDDFSLRDESSVSRVANLLDRYAKDVEYIDLAGGFSRLELGFRQDSREDLTVDFMVANTTCAYFVSKGAAKALLNMLVKAPEKEYLSPDFVVTSLNDTDFRAQTVLPSALPFVHGTREGGMTSSIPYS